MKNMRQSHLMQTYQGGLAVVGTTILSVGLVYESEAQLNELLQILTQMQKKRN